MQVVESLKKIVGNDYLRQDLDSLNTYGRDWTKGYKSKAMCIVFPQTTEHVSKILKYCNSNNVKVVTSGGRTGLVGGACAVDGEVVLSMEKLNKIINIDSVGMTITCEAGVVTQIIQETAKNVGLFFPLDLAAKGSSQIGGNIATNAGGINAVKYGMMRKLVLGLEVVLADGSVMQLGSELLKNNTGYDLKQLFIGSEGTLGVITKATLKLEIQPKSKKLMFLGISDITKISTILETLNKKGSEFISFEFFDAKCLCLVLNEYSQLKNPLSNHYNYYLLIEFINRTDQEVEAEFERLLESDLVQDGVIAINSQQENQIWSLRENISEALAKYYYLKKEDISVPVRLLAQFCSDLERLALQKFDGFDIFMFGHIGDGNIHLNFASNNTQASLDELHERCIFALNSVWELLARFKGSPSAEHGIGLTKKELLKKFKNPQEIFYMKEIKKIFDANNILNTNKIID